MKLGVQLYSLRSIIQNNIDDVFHAIKSYGYHGVELAGFYGLSAQALKDKLNHHGLEVISTHESIERLSKDIDQVMADYNILGTRDIVIPYTTMNNQETYHNMLPIIKKVATTLTQNGFNVHYHNHANEFESFDDQYVIEHLLKDVPEIKLELDVYWATFAHIDVLSFIEKYQQRISFIHAKDMKMLEDGPHFASVGQGIIDFKDIYKLKHDVWIVENDRPHNDPLENIKDSIVYIKNQWEV